MPEILVGCCGLAGLKLSSYAARFRVLEIQSTFYGLPMKSTVEKWRTSVPDLAFTIKAFQGVTHPADSPTWTRAKRELRGVDRAEVGMLRPSAFVRRAWERTVEIADALGAKVVVIQLPPSFAYSKSNLQKLKQFFSGIRTDFIPAITD